MPICPEVSLGRPPRIQLFSLALVSIVLTSGHRSAHADGVASDMLTDEVIVTTQRMFSNLRENAGNIAIIDTQSLPSLYPTDLINQAPGVLIHRGNGQEHLTSIRSPVLSGGAGAGSFLFAEDGIPFRAPAFSNVNALMDAMSYDTARVEVVRGPASALYGSNAVHGLVNFVTRDAREAGTSADMTLGSYGRYRLNAHSAIAPATRLAVSLAGEEDAYRAESGFAQQKFRFKHAWQASNRTMEASIAGMNLNQETAGYVNGRDAYKTEALAKGNVDADEAFRDAWSVRAALRTTWEIDGERQLIITPYLRRNAMRFGMHFLPGDPIEENDHSSLGVQSAYIMNSGSNRLAIGFDADYSDGHLSEEQFKPTLARYEPGLHYDYDVQAIVLAPFIHHERDITDNTRLTLGLRAEFTRYDYDNKTEDGNFGQGNRLFRPADRTDNFTDLSPKIGLVHDISPNLTTFVNLARGSRAPQTTDLYRLRVGQTVGDIKSEHLDSVEIGLRGAFGPLSGSVSIYDMRKKNYYFRDSSNNNVSSGRTRHRGIETDLTLRLSEQVDLSGSASYAEHVFDFSHRPEGSPRPENIITKGKRIDSAPRTLANLALRWAPTPDRTLSLAWEHVGDYVTDPGNLHRYQGHDLAHLTWREQFGNQVELRVRVVNLFDRAYATRADFNALAGSDRYFPGEPRHIYVTLKRDF
jgi:iron complex outermembrane receptor protein